MTQYRRSQIEQWDYEADEEFIAVMNLVDPKPWRVQAKIWIRLDDTTPILLTISSQILSLTGGKADQACATPKDAEVLAMVQDAIKRQTIDGLPAILDKLGESDHWLTPLLRRWWMMAETVSAYVPPKPKKQKRKPTIFD